MGTKKTKKKLSVQKNKLANVGGGAKGGGGFNIHTQNCHSHEGSGQGKTIGCQLQPSLNIHTKQICGDLPATQGCAVNTHVLCPKGQ